VYETFCKQKIAMLNPGRDKIETFCDQKIALLKDKIVAVRVLRRPSANFPFPFSLDREVVYWYLSTRALLGTLGMPRRALVDTSRG
jgi:hypothetical protein